MSVRLVNFPCHAARHNHQVGTELVERFKQEGKATHAHMGERKDHIITVHHYYSSSELVLFNLSTWMNK